MNNISLIGRLGRDPELKDFNKNGETCKLAKFSLAVDRGGDVDWFDCVLYGNDRNDRRPETLEKWKKKGDELGIIGKMVSRKYEDKSGNKRTAWEVNVSSFDFIGKKTKGEPVPAGFENTEEDVPF